MNLSSFEEIFRTNKKPINFYDSTFIDTDFKDEAFNIDYKPSNSMNDINNNNIICSIEQVKEKKNQFFNNKFFDDDRFKNDENFLSKDIIKEDKDLQDIFKLKRDLKIKKNKLGRKRVFQDIYSNNDEKIKNIDMIRICKNLVLTYTLKFLNEQIKKIYNGFIGGGILFKKLLDITQEEKADNKIESIEIFFQKTLKEIFSVNISKKYTSYLHNHNKIKI